jgi:hypothetical protein
MKIKLENQYQHIGRDGEFSIINIEFFDYDWVKGVQIAILGISLLIEFGGTKHELSTTKKRTK